MFFYMFLLSFFVVQLALNAGCINSTASATHGGAVVRGNGNRVGARIAPAPAARASTRRILPIDQNPYCWQGLYAVDLSSPVTKKMNFATAFYSYIKSLLEAEGSEDLMRKLPIVSADLTRFLGSGDAGDSSGVAASALEFVTEVQTALINTTFNADDYIADAGLLASGAVLIRGLRRAAAE